MARRRDSNLISLAVLGAIVFTLGRCSATPPPDTAPSALMAPVDAGADLLAPPTMPASEVARAPSAADTAEYAPEAETSEFEHSSDTGLSCGGKRYCGEMDSCAEANFYLNQCGLGRLDGDGDGVPCEKIC